VRQQGSEQVRRHAHSASAPRQTVPWRITPRKPPQWHAAFLSHEVYAPEIACLKGVNTPSDAGVFNVAHPTVISRFGPSVLIILPVCSLGCTCAVHGLSDCPLLPGPPVRDQAGRNTKLHRDRI
jgi:hypothetical protein